MSWFSRDIKIGEKTTELFVVKVLEEMKLEFDRHEFDRHSLNLEKIECLSRILLNLLKARNQ